MSTSWAIGSHLMFHTFHICVLSKTRLTSSHQLVGDLCGYGGTQWFMWTKSCNGQITTFMWFFQPAMAVWLTMQQRSTMKDQVDTLQWWLSSWLCWITNQFTSHCCTHRQQPQLSSIDDGQHHFYSKPAYSPSLRIISHHKSTCA